MQIAEGTYDIRFKFIKPIEVGGRMVLETKGIVNQKKNDQQGVDVIEMKGVVLPAMEGELIPFYTVKGRNIFPFWVEMEKVD